MAEAFAEQHLSDPNRQFDGADFEDPVDEDPLLEMDEAPDLQLLQGGMAETIVPECNSRRHSPRIRRLLTLMNLISLIPSREPKMAQLAHLMSI